MTPEQAAEHILKAAGSSLRHYTPQSKEAIIKAAILVLDAEKARCASIAENHGTSGGHEDCAGCGEDIALAIRQEPRS